MDRDEGILLGGDWRSPSLIIGMIVGGGLGTQTSPSTLSQKNTTNTKSLILGIYHSLIFLENGRYDLVVNGVFNRQRSKRFDKPLGVAYRADANFNSYNISGNLSTSWRFRLPNQYSIRPNVGMALGYNHRDPFIERNAGAFNQQYSQSIARTIEPYVGIGLRRKWMTETYAIKLTGVIEQGYDLANNKGTANVFSAAGPVAGTVVTRLNLGKSATYLTFYGSVLDMTTNFKCVLGYTAALQKRSSSHTVTIKGEYRF